MAEDNVTNASKVETIKAPPAFNDRYEAIDVGELEEGETITCKASCLYLIHHPPFR